MDILSVEEYDLIFDKLLKIAEKCSEVVKEVSQFSYRIKIIVVNKNLIKIIFLSIVSVSVCIVFIFDILLNSF